MWDTVLDALLDTLKLFPFLFVLYILIELLEHKTRVGKPNRALSGKCAPLIGGATGLIPMCGFSVMASKLFERKYLTIGTLLAVFIATNDEALLVLAVSSIPIGEKILSIVLMCAIKFAVGVGIGYLVDFIAKKRGCASALLTAPEETAHHAYEHEHDHDHDDDHEHDHNHDHEHDGGAEEPQACEHKHKSGVQVYLLSPLLHALQIAAVILAFNLAFGLMFYFIGEEKVIGFLQGSGLWYQPLVCCLVGLIPNCASSVVLAETFAIGGITFGSCLAGLMTNAGLGVLVLFRNTKALKRNLGILGATLAIGVAAGYVINLIALAIG